jgi:hypothetical protein
MRIAKFGFRNFIPQFAIRIPKLKGHIVIGSGNSGIDIKFFF